MKQPIQFSLKILALASVAALALMSSASAAVTFGYTSVGVNDTTWTGISAGQTNVAAFNIAGATTTFSGVSFVAFGAIGGGATGGITATYSVPGSAWATPASGYEASGAATGILNSAAYTLGNNGLLEFSGLTVGQAYEIRFIVADNRSFGGGAPAGRQFEMAEAINTAGTVTLTGQTSNKLTYAATSGDYGIISATFTAGVDGKAAFLPRNYESVALGGASAGTQMNAIQIVAVPEPSAALLGGLGVLCLLRRRRN